MKALLCLFLGLSLILVSCEDEEAKPTDPGGAFRLFDQAVAERDVEAIWELLDSTTKAVFNMYYKRLKAASIIIDRYFEPIDRQPAREKSGVSILEEVKSGKDLFIHLFDADSIPYKGGHKRGAEIEELRINDAENEATIVTYSGQQFELVREEDGHWRISSYQEIFNQALYPIEANLNELKSYAQEAIAKEENRREELLQTYFLEQKLQRSLSG